MTAPGTPIMVSAIRAKGSPERPQRAFTLIEVLLTLVIMAIIAALAWPILAEPIEAMRLTKSAEQIRVRWCQTRVKAMETGLIHVFRYTLDGNKYEIKCRAQCETQFDPFTGVDMTDASFAEQPGSLSVDEQGELPKGVTFVGGQTDVDSRAQLFELQSQEIDDYGTTLNATWSEPILFYPDGTASTARLMLKNKHGLYIELKMRGITGIVQIGETQTLDMQTPEMMYSN